MLPIFVIAGPTASGKTGVSIKVAEALREEGVICEIINADSIQLYKDLKILTAFPTQEEINRASHHLFGILEPDELYSVAKWKQLAELEIDKLHKQGKIPILCGGTGFYLRSIVSGIAYIPDVPESYRQEVREKFERVGRENFMKDLLALDPTSKLNKDDTQRILRSYEVVSFTGKPLSYWWREGNNCRYSNTETGIRTNIKTLILLPKREVLWQNIRDRCIQMMKSGAIDEVQEFLSRYPKYKGPLDRVIGLSEIKEFLNKKLSSSELIEKMVIRTRQYAKRQSTWFRNQMPEAIFTEAFSPEIIEIFKREVM